MDQNGKFISVEKTCFLFFTQILDPQNFTFASKTAKSGLMSDSWGGKVAPGKTLNFQKKIKP